jgi:membrane protease YdiL (CAAX protease family)
MTHDPGTSVAMPQAAGTPLNARRALVILVLFLVAQLGGGFLAGLSLRVYFGLLLGRSVPDEVRPSLLIGSALVGLTTAGVVVFRLARRSLPGTSLGDSLHPIGWAGAPLGRCAAGVVIGGSLAAMYALELLARFPPTPEQPLGPFVDAALTAGLPRLLWGVLAVGIAPAVEEFVFRGVLYGGFSRSWGPGIAGVLVTVLFVATHTLYALTYWPAVIAITSVGVGALVMRVWTASLLPAVLLHSTYNALLVVAVYVGVA